MNERDSEYGMHPTQISEWKRQRLDAGDTLFNRDGARQHREQREQEVERYEHMRRLKMDLEWLKKKLPHPVNATRMMIDLDVPHISVRRPYGQGLHVFGRDHQLA